MRSLRGNAAARRLLGLVVVGHIASGAFSAEDACVKVLHALCGNETTSVDLCLGCTTQHQPVFRAADCANAEMTQFCNQAAGSPVQPTVVDGDSTGIYQLMRLRIPSPLAVFDIQRHLEVHRPAREPCKQ